MTKKEFRKYMETTTNLTKKEIDWFIKEGRKPILKKDGTVTVFMPAVIGFTRTKSMIVDE